MSPRALQQAPFRVLVGANMPAVLVELGFLTNPQQEQQLASDAHQNTLVQALVEGIVRYRAVWALREPQGRPEHSRGAGGAR
jgi:N-acetylmuramoyl-L-alanine amidase